jgi:hypothetical protein
MSGGGGEEGIFAVVRNEVLFHDSALIAAFTCEGAYVIRYT